jgi:hypothetical protein
MKSWAVVALVFAVLIGSVGCSGNKTFKVIFSNRIAPGHDITCYANGELLGTVAWNATGEFSFETRRLGTPAGPDPAGAEVTFTARDMVTGLLSHEIPRVISSDRTEYVEISAGNF